MARGAPLSGPVLARLGDRLHLQHGPIDVILRAEGAPEAVRVAETRAWERFRTILDELVAELPELRRPFDPARTFAGSVARRMQAGVAAFPDRFVTPMAAVAGSVADEVCAVMTDGLALTRVYVNDGGDIALHLAPGESFAVGLVPVPERPALLGKAVIRADDPVRGIATSGRHGRSFSLGIADAVTVLATSAARADAAATLVANAVDLPGNPKIARTPARDLDPDSDLGERAVTTSVEPLTDGETAAAIAAGVATADAMRASGAIAAAVLCLGDVVEVVGDPRG
ncbi:MAG: UPF0280 family protein [Actinomycetota bacterium]